MRRIIIEAGGICLGAELNDSPTAGKVWDALPIEGSANRWGDEIYFGIPVLADEEPDARGDGRRRAGLLAAGERVLYLLRPYARQPRRGAARSIARRTRWGMWMAMPRVFVL